MRCSAAATPRTSGSPTESSRLRTGCAPRGRAWCSRALVTEDIERDVGNYLFALVHRRVDLPRQGSTAERLFAIALEERVEQSLNRVFRRLGLIYPPANIAAAYEGVTSSNTRLKGNAVEYLENALAPEHRGLVLPLVDERGEGERMRLAQQRYAIRPAGYEQTLEAVLQPDDARLRACPLFVARSRRERSLLPLVKSNLSTLNVLVREIASLARLAIAAGG